MFFEYRPFLYDAPLSPAFWKSSIGEMAIVNTFGPVLLNALCIGYMLLIIAEWIAPGSILLT